MKRANIWKGKLGWQGTTHGSRRSTAGTVENCLMEVPAMSEYVEREAAIKALMNDAPEQVGYSREDAADCIRYMDAADVAPVRHGRWRPQVVLGQKAWDCSECMTLGSPHWKWCPVCGCKMDLEAADA